MVITLYDSDNPDSIPDGVAAAGYCDGYAAAAWNARGWQRFPHALRIAVFATTNDGDVGDVERGDMLPWELPDWIQMRRAAGHPNPWGYVNLSNWGPTKTEFELRGIPEPPWWVADYDGIPVLMPGAIAKQYANQTIIPGNPGYLQALALRKADQEVEGARRDAADGASDECRLECARHLPLLLCAAGPGDTTAHRAGE